MKTKFLFLVSLASFAFFMSCSSDETTTTDETVVASKTVTENDAVANSQIDSSVDDVSVIVEDQFSAQLSANSRTVEPRKGILPLCATVTTVVGTNSYTRTIDFGTEGCAMPNGNVLKGKIIVSFSKNTTALSNTISYRLDNFYHNDNLVEGEKSVVRELKTSNLLETVHPVITHAIDVKVTFPEAKIYTRKGTRVREMIAGMATPNIREDDAFRVWGTETTTLPDGKTISNTITTPLEFSGSCNIPVPVKGVIEIKKGDVIAVLDHGNGECDNLAALTTNGETKVIELKRKLKN